MMTICIGLACWCLLAASSGASLAAGFYVSPGGSDRNPGTQAKPFRTLEGARDAVRQFKGRHGLPKGGVTVWLRGGTYPLTKTFELDARDSGRADARVVYRAYLNERVVLGGGRGIPGKAFKPVTDPAILVRLPEESRGKVRQVDLKALGIADYGAMQAHGWGRGYVNPGMELFVDDRPMQLARWPNRGTVPIGRILDPGSSPRDGDFSNRGGTFTYDRPGRWTQADDPWLCGYFAYGYADDTMKVKSIDLAARTITLAQAHRYGLKGGEHYHRYYALNLLEEIDAPGECHLDRRAGRLYLWPPSDLRRARISVSLLDSPMVAMEGASYVTLRGMTLEVARGMGVYIERGSDNLIAGCTLRNLGSVAICMGQGVKMDPSGVTFYALQLGAERGEPVKVEPVSRQLGAAHMGGNDPTWNRQAGRGHGVVGCDIYNTGAGGIILSGGERKTLMAGGSYVLNCHIHHYNRRDANGCEAVNIDGVGNRVAHCLIHDAPLGAILLTGNDHVVESNEFHDVCRMADDMGVFYMGRDPSAQGNVVRYNFFHHTGNPNARTTGTWAVHLDDGSCGTTVTGNVFYKTQTSAVWINGGHDHVFRHNVFVDTNASIASGWDNATWSGFVRSPLQVLRLRKAVDVTRPPYSTRYPGLADIFNNDPGYRRGQQVWRNVSVRSGEFGAGSNDARDNLVIDEDPGFVDAVHMDFRLRPDSVVFQKIPGFRKIPFEKMGLYRDVYRTTLPPRRAP